MMNKTAVELVSEIKKLRNDMDAIKADALTIAEQIQIIAVNTTPENDSEPAGESEPAET